VKERKQLFYQNKASLYVQIILKMELSA